MEKKKRYYYTTSVDSEIGQKLTDFVGKCADVTRAADAFVRKYGAETYIESPLGCAGGVELLCFDREPDISLWRRIDLADGIAYEVNVSLEQQDSIAKDIKNGKKKEWDKAENAIQLETERQMLPIISEFALLDILRPLIETDSNGKSKPFALQQTPTMFEYRRQWYICLSYQMQDLGEEVEQIMASTYKGRQLAMKRLGAKNRKKK